MAENRTINCFKSISLILIFAGFFSLPGIAQSALIDSLRTDFYTSSNDSLKMETALRLGVQWEGRDMDSALFYYNYSIRTAAELQYFNRLAAVRVNRAFAFSAMQWQDSALTELDRALSLYKEAKNVEGQLMTTFNLGVFCATFNRYLESIGHYKDALQLSHQLEETTYRSKILNNLSLVYNYIGDKESFINYLHQTIDLKEQTNDKSIGTAYVNLGLAYNAVDESVKAIAAYKEGLRYIRKKQMARFQEIDPLVNIASTYIQMGVLDSAKRYIDEAFGLSLIIQNVQGEMKCYNTLAGWYRAQKNFELSILNYQLAIDKNPEVGNKRYLALCYRSLAGGYLDYWREKGSKSELLNKANTAAESALTIAQELNTLQLINEVAELLFEINRNRKDINRINQYADLYFETSDSLQTEEQKKKLLEIEAKYQSEKKDLQIQLLEQDKELSALKLEELAKKEQQERMITFSVIGALILMILVAFLLFRLYRQKNQGLQVMTEKNKIISQQKEENDLLLKEIHHRVKNNLQVISSLLDLQSMGIQDGQALSAVSDGQSRVKSMALIHQNLYQNKNLGEISFLEYADQLTKQIASIYSLQQTVEVTVESKSISLDIDTAIPIGLILNELISNAFKHAFELVKNPKMNIRLEEKNKGNFELTVQDNGCGLPPGVDIVKSKSLGLRLVRRLAKQLYGTVALQNQEGARFVVNFKNTQARKETD